MACFDADIIVVGGGLTGLCLSCLLASEGFHVVCVDKESPEQQAQPDRDGRTMAISWGSQKILARAGLWEHIAPHACPIRDIRILDDGQPVHLHFSSEEVSGQDLGWIVDISPLRQTLLARARDLPNLRHIAPATWARITCAQENVTLCLEETEDVFRARLLVGADGRGSRIRKEIIRTAVRTWPYGQTALVCAVTHENSHHHTAIEDFRPEGPFAILPMTDDATGAHRSSVVWSVHNTTRFQKRWTPTGETRTEIVEAALQARFPSNYGQIHLIGRVFSYPLTFLHATTLIGTRCALVGDAAHGLHPIAGQGLNVGLRDVAELFERIIDARACGKDIGGDALLSGYQRARRWDNTLMAAATDTLNTVFSTALPPIVLARRAALKTVARLPRVKKQIMAYAMGAAGNLPRVIRAAQNKNR